MITSIQRNLSLYYQKLGYFLATPLVFWKQFPESVPLMLLCFVRSNYIFIDFDTGINFLLIVCTSTLWKVEKFQFNIMNSFFFIKTRFF